MKARINRQELVEALSVVGGVLAARTTKPILQCLLLQVEADYAVLGATDLELSARYTIGQLEVSEPGTVVISADKLSQIVRESSDEILELASDDRNCHVRGADAHYKLFLQDPAEFPAIAHVEGAPDFEVLAPVLQRMATWTVFAAARENTRYAINGVLWERRKENLTLVATDGRRLSLAGGKVLDKAGSEVSVIVPTKAIHLFQRLATSDDEKVAVKVTSNQVVLRTRRATLAAALVEGRFPQYREVIPTDNTKSVTLRTQEFSSAVRRAALLTNEESKGVRLSFGDGELALTSRAPEQGEARVTLAVEYSDEPIEIGFNPVFLNDVLRVTPEETIRLDMKSPDRPGVIRCGADFLYVVMPINLA